MLLSFFKSCSHRCITSCWWRIFGERHKPKEVTVGPQQMGQAGSIDRIRFGFRHHVAIFVTAGGFRIDVHRPGSPTVTNHGPAVPASSPVPPRLAAVGAGAP